MEGNNSDIVLIIDGLDFLLAQSEDHSTAVLELKHMLLDVRQVGIYLAVPKTARNDYRLQDPVQRVHTTITIMHIDEPIFANEATSLERQHRSLIMSQAYEAYFIISLQPIPTGPAPDLGGVMRITRGGDDSAGEVDEQEFVYSIGRHGGFKMFNTR